jgi:lipopolysaccharide transport system permease protein/teichoic acid transport system permease protein
VTILRKYLREIFKRKDLVKYLVTSGLKAQHRNSFLGYLWWMLDPLLSVAVYYFLVVIILKRGGEGYGPFLVVGLVVFRSLSSTMTSSAKSITKQAGIIKQVYLPKVIFPIAAGISQMINFFFGVLVIIIFLVINKITIGISVLWFPFIFIFHLLFLISIALFIAYICVFIRDVENILSYVNMLLRYGSPIIWTMSALPAKFVIIARINPLTTFLNSYRNIFLYNAPPEIVNLIIIGLFSFLLTFLMIYYYYRTEHKIVKTL